MLPKRGWEQFAAAGLHWMQNWAAVCMVRARANHVVVGSSDMRARDSMPQHQPDHATLSEIIEMALSDAASFENIETIHGLSPDAVKALMRKSLKPGSYRAWRKRVRHFSDRRDIYK